MANSGLHGPHKLTTEQIDAVVIGKGAGAYALGNQSADTFLISYVGRSDDDLNGRLKDWVGSKYPMFKYGFFKSAKEAFEKECHLFHDLARRRWTTKSTPPGRKEPIGGAPDVGIRLIESVAATAKKIP
jgi:hypothetical protein